jgi:hypothetical protein
MGYGPQFFVCYKVWGAQVRIGRRRSVAAAAAGAGGAAADGRDGREFVVASLHVVGWAGGTEVGGRGAGGRLGGVLGGVLGRLGASCGRLGGVFGFCWASWGRLGVYGCEMVS